MTHRQHTLLPKIGKEFRPVCKAQKIRRTDVKRPAHLQAGLRAKHDPARIQEKQIGPEISDRNFPLIDDGSPPVTRPTTLVIVLGPAKVALSSVRT